MHSKRRCKIYICSVIPGELESFRNYKGLSIIFPKILDEIWRITKVRHFLIPLSITFLNPKILGFLFSTKNSLTYICSVIPGELESFRNYKGLSIIFPKILDEIWRITKVRHFLIPLSITFLNPKILGFLFSTKNSLTWEEKCEN